MAISEKRQKELVKAVKANVVVQIENDLVGYTENLKELWEECHSGAEQSFVNAKLRGIVRIVNELEF